MCGRMNQHMFEKLNQDAIEIIKKHSLDDLSSSNNDDSSEVKKCK